MGLTMRERKAVSREIKGKYRRAGKKEKGNMLDWFCHATGYNRCYAGRVLRAEVGAGRGTQPGGGGKAQKQKSREKQVVRARKYVPEVVGPLGAIWEVAGKICGKRLAAAIPDLVQAMERSGECRLSPQVRALLLEMSAATIDRLLAPEKRKLRLKARSGTKPGTLLKSQIPIRTFADWDEGRPGFVEVDLVAHDGGDGRGEFIQTLDMLDVFSGWTETRAVKNKAQRWVFEALKDARAALPFPLLGLDSDNGGEFINQELLRYCRQNEITFTRSRPYNKNDSCHVEQKNWTVVRQTVGYRRFQTDQQLRTLNRLYRALRLYTNFFIPSMKLVRKTRNGSRVTKKYDKPLSPYRRLLASPHLSQNARQRLSSLFYNLNPAQLRRTISSLQDRLYPSPQQLPQLTQKEVTNPSHFEYISLEAAF